MTFLRVSCLFQALIALSGCGSQAPITPLIGAARAGDAGEIGRLLRAGADPNLGGGVNDWPPLVHAIHKKQIGSMKALIAGGANIEATSRVGETPLMMAAGYGDVAAVRLLLAAGADPRKRDNDDKTALDYAIAGVPDIDNFTVGACLTGAVEALLERDPALEPVSGGFGKLERIKTRLSGCAKIGRLLDRRR